MDIITQQFRSIIGDDIRNFSKILDIDDRTLSSLLYGKSTIHITTAKRVLDTINEYSQSQYVLDDLFIVENLKGYERERKVIFEDSGKQMTEDDWISVVRYMIEGKFRAFGVVDFYWIVIMLSAITLLFFIFFK